MIADEAFLLRQYVDAGDGISVGFGSPCTPAQVACVTGPLNSAGSMTCVSAPTLNVGATCHPHTTWQFGLFCEAARRLPKIHTLFGTMPAAIISRHIS